MSNEYKIRTIKEISELDERQQSGFLLDLAEWLRFNNEAKKILSVLPDIGISFNTDYIHWVDDGRNGEIKSITISAVATE